MRVPLDHNVPQGLAGLLTRHTVRTAADAGWAELSDNALLSAAEKAGFQVIVTADRNIRYQQNLAYRRVSLVVLSTNNWRMIRVHSAPIVAAVDAAKPNSYIEVTVA